MLENFVAISLNTSSNRLCEGDILGFYATRVEKGSIVRSISVDFKGVVSLDDRVKKLKEASSIFKAGDLIIAREASQAIRFLARDLNYCLRRAPYFNTVRYIEFGEALYKFYKNNNSDENLDLTGFLGKLKFNFLALEDSENSQNAIIDMVFDLRQYGLRFEYNSRKWADNNFILDRYMLNSYTRSRKLSNLVEEDLIRNGLYELVVGMIYEPPLPIDALKEEHDLSKFTVIDIECNGTGNENGEIIEIAAIKFNDWGATETFQLLVKSTAPIKENYSMIHGITDEYLEGCVDIATAIKKLASFLDDDNILVGSNVKSADLRLLNRDAKRYGYPNLFSNKKYVDTVTLARNLHPEYDKHGVDSLTDKLKIRYRGQKHRALWDCFAEAEIFKKLRDEAIEKNKKEAIEVKLYNA